MPPQKRFGHFPFCDRCLFVIWCLVLPPGHPEYFHMPSSYPPEASPLPESSPLSPRSIYLKAALFALILFLSAALLLLPSPTLGDFARTAALLSLALWSACRLYYFAFYVIEKYIDPTYRYAGLWDFTRRRLLQQSNPSNLFPSTRETPSIPTTLPPKDGN